MESCALRLSRRDPSLALMHGYGASKRLACSSLMSFHTRSGFDLRPSPSVVDRCSNLAWRACQLATSTAMLLRRVRPTSRLMSWGSPVMIVTAQRWLNSSAIATICASVVAISRRD
jgi:hypothetical protein